MNETTKNILIIGGVAFAAFLIYKKVTAPGVVGKSPITKSTAGTGNSVASTTGNGSGGDANFWNTLGANGQGLNQGISSVESLYNSANNLLGFSSTDTGNGNNGTAG
jgi:hypothetical protein